MENQTKIQEIISENALYISNILKIRISQQRLPNKIVKQVHRILMAESSQNKVDLYSRLSKVLQKIEPYYERSYKACLILIDRLWLVVPGSKAEEDIFYPHRLHWARS